MRKQIGALIGFALVGGCSNTERVDAGGEITRSSAAAIIGGGASTSRDAVVLLVSNNGMGQSICTGTLVAPNLVLTARHCVTTISDGRFVCNENGEPTTSYAGGRYVRDGQPGLIGVYAGADAPARAAAFEEPAAYGAEILHDDSAHICAGDLALLRLERAVPDAVVAAVRLDQLPRAQDQVTVVGFGITDENREASLRMERSGVPVLRVGPEPGSADLPPVSRSMFEVGEATCGGDSGGPAIDERTGAVVGVVTAGGNGTSGDPQDRAGRCSGETTRNYFTATAPFSELLRDGFARSGFRPWIEGTPAPSRRELGAPCDDGDACESGVCVEDEVGDHVCSTSCTRRSNECPDRWTCDLPADSTVGVCRPTLEETSVSREAKASGAPGCSVAAAIRTSNRPLSPPAVLGLIAAFAALGARRARRQA